MIIYKPGQDIFTSTAQFIVNPTNTKGVSGKGLALESSDLLFGEFKKRYPKNYKEYHSFCSSSSPKGGDLLFYYPEQLDRLKGDRGIINFCTKEDWKKPSKIEWIEKGMTKLVEQLTNLYSDGKYPSPLLALPMLGCGEGGLDEGNVLRVITQSLEGCKFDVEIYTSKLYDNLKPVKEVDESE